jgi:hypothetical protein
MKRLVSLALCGLAAAAFSLPAGSSGIDAGPEGNGKRPGIKPGEPSGRLKIPAQRKDPEDRDSASGESASAGGASSRGSASAGSSRGGRSTGASASGGTDLGYEAEKEEEEFRKRERVRLGE